MNRRPIFILMLLAAAVAVLWFSDLWDSESAGNTPLTPSEATESAVDSGNLPVAQPEAAADVNNQGLAEAESGEANRREVASTDAGEVAADTTPDEPPTELLQVSVQDPAGEPIELVPVSLWTINRGRHYPWQVESTLQDGIASFALPITEESKDLKLAVGFEFPYVGSKTVQLSRSDLPTEPIVLNLEPTGSVAVQLIGPDDQPWGLATEVRLAPTPGFFERKSKALQKSGPGIGALKSDAEGKVLFPFVALKKQYIVGVQYNSWGKWERQTIAAPAVAGELIDIVLKLIEPVPMIRFRLLDPEGAPVVSRDWFGILSQFDLSGGGMSSRGSSANSSTDAEGYTIYPLNVSQKLASWTLRQLTLSCRVPNTGPMLYARIDLTPKLNAGMQDIGDVQLLKFKPLVSGRILSDRGTPVAGVSLTMEEQTVITGPDKQSEAWDYLSGSTKVDAEGNFTVSGSTPTAALKLTFEADGFHPLVQEVEVGSSGHQFAFEASFVISGQLIMAEGNSAKRASVRFVPPGAIATGSMRSGRVSNAVMQEDGRFVISGLKDQTSGEIAVFYGRSETALSRISDVSPMPADTAQDPRINPLRIGEIHHYEVSFMNSAGKKVRGVQYLLSAVDPGQQSGTGKPLQASTGFGSFLELQSQIDRFKLSYYTEGFQYDEAEIEPGETIITLKTAVMATLRLDNTLELPPGTELQIELESEAAMGLANDRVTLPAFIPAVLPILPIPAAGTYRIKLRLKDIESKKSTEVYWPGGAESLEILVGEHEGQEFNASFPNEQIQEAAAKLKAEN
jgi:hypothetical protein